MFATPASGQLWSGILNSTRAIDWTDQGVVGGIPHRTTRCGAVVAQYNGTAGAINSAIAGCTAGQFVELGAGTFNLTSSVDFNGKSNVTLRGQGPMSTILVFTGAATGCGLGANVCIWDGHGDNPGGTINFSATCDSGCTPGSTQVTLSNVTSLVVGGILVFDQKNDSDTVPSGIWVNDGACCTEGGSPGRLIGGVRANQQQHVKVTAISGTTVTFTPGLYMQTWRSGQTPSAWWPQSKIELSGIEDMTLDHGSSSASGLCGSGACGVAFMSALNSWMKNIRSLNSGRNHVWVHSGDAHIEIRDSYFYGTRSAGTVSYGIEPLYMSDALFINNIFEHMPNGIVGGDMVGVVFAYNYALDHYYTNPTTFMQTEYMAHDAMAAFNLHEGNDSNGLFTDAVHGTNAVGTIFRNRLSGFETGKTTQTNAGIIDAYNRAYNFVGNIMGTVSYHTAYQTNSDLSIWLLGFHGGSAGATDAVVAASLMRWGNYDTVNAATRWLCSEASPAAITFVNATTCPGPDATPATLPASFFLSAKPSSWWGTPWGVPPWPAIGPDVTGGDSAVGPGGFGYKIPARLCYENTAKDGANLYLAFDATTCYIGSSDGGGGVAVDRGATAAVRVIRRVHTWQRFRIILLLFFFVARRRQYVAA